MSSENLYQMIKSTADKYPKSPAFIVKKAGEWQKITYSETMKKIRLTGLGLMELGVEFRGRVGLLCENRPEWGYVDYAAHAIGAYNVSLYETLGEKDLVYILNDCRPKVVIVSKLGHLDMIMDRIDELPSVETVVTLNGPLSSHHAGHSAVMTFDELLEMGKKASKDVKKEYDNRQKKVTGDEIASLVYTSGTTGEPKGVMLTHNNLLSNVEAALTMYDISNKDTLLSFLPLSHVLERVAFNVSIHEGTAIAFVESRDKVGDNIREIQPTLMAAVPRLFEKMYTKINANIAAESSIKQKIFAWAVANGIKKTKTEQMGKKASGFLKFKVSIADKMVFSKVRTSMGGNLRFFLSGGSALSPELGLFFTGISIPIYQGYGLTETSPIITLNSPESNRIGSNGKPIPGVKVKIANDGEILTRGPHVMKGYWEKDDKTGEVLSKDGWFMTGDIGYLDKENYLFITDRKKNILVNAYGKNIAPQPVENALVNEPMINQVVLIGNDRKFVSVLIVPDFDYLNNYAKENNIPHKNMKKLLAHPKIKALFDGALAERLKDFSDYERPKKHILLEEEFTEEGGELTPTMKIKRNFIDKKYKKQIDSLYSNT